MMAKRIKSNTTHRRTFLQSTAAGLSLAASGFSFPAIIQAQDDWNQESFYTMKKVDTHFHIRNLNLSYFDVVKKDNFQLVVIAVDSRALPIQIQYIQNAKKMQPEHVQYVTSFSMIGWDQDNWVKKTLDHLNHEFDQGAVGIKIWKNIGMVYKTSGGKIVMVDHEKFNPIWELLIERDKTLIAHLADPRDSWLPVEKMRNPGDQRYFSNNPDYHMYHHPEFPSNEDILKARDTVISRYPKLKFLGAHLASLEWDLKRLGHWLSDHPESAVDLAARIDDLQLHDRDELRAFMLNYQDQLCYATDIGISERTNIDGFRERCHSVWKNDWTFFSTGLQLNPREDINIQGLELPDSVLQKLYYSNAKKFFPDLL